jgi:hypothetical protein
MKKYSFAIQIPFELSISLLILVAPSVSFSINTVLFSIKTHKGYGVTPARSDVKLF